jgi:hypothetical protein
VDICEYEEFCKNHIKEGALSYCRMAPLYPDCYVKSLAREEYKKEKKNHS